MFTFKMPTLEFRNKTWTWLDFLDAVKKGLLSLAPLVKEICGLILDTR